MMGIDISPMSNEHSRDNFNLDANRDSFIQLEI